MERRYQVRLKELLGDAVVRPEQLQGMLERLERFVEPFAACLVRKKQRTLTQQYVAGLARRSNTRTSSRSPIITIRIARRCRSSSANTLGTIGRCLRNWCSKSARDWPRGRRAGVRSLVVRKKRDRSRSGSNANGVGDGERSTTVRWECIWRMSRPRNRRWWTSRLYLPEELGALESASRQGGVPGGGEVSHPA